MFIERLKAARKSAGLSQAALAKMLFISQQAYAKYENGTSSPNPETLSRITTILDVSPDYLLGRDISLQNKKPANDTVDGHSEESSMDIEVLNLLRELSPAQLEQAKSYIRFLKQQEDL